MNVQTSAPVPLRFDAQNHPTWERDRTVNYYVPRKFLYGPEEALLPWIRDNVKPSTLLDLGVGAGRTTPFFAPVAREYVGLDYSSSMIETCRRKFGTTVANARFLVQDARAMTDLPDGHFDFALYSYNGLDYVDHIGRMAALGEIRRVLRAGAYFLFSTHNATAVDQIFALRLSVDPRKLVQAVATYATLRRVNRNWLTLLDQDIVSFNDGAHDFGLLTYYIRPQTQIAQLKSLGFEDVRVFALSGQELSSDTLAKPSDKWLYYLAKRGR